MATASMDVSAQPTTHDTGPFFTTERVTRWMTIFLWLGIAARSLRYFLRFPLWEDECFLCVNFIDRSFAELLTPLTYHQVAPPLFLWAERASVLTFGYSEWSLRLVPFIASIAALLLFRHLAARLLAGPALLLAFGIFAVAYPGIRYAAEAKQYATDLLAALVLLTLAVEWYRSRRVAWLWALAALAPLLLWLSYPAAFVVGGISLAIGVTVLRDLKNRVHRQPTTHPLPLTNHLTPHLIAWLAFNLTVIIGFSTLFFVIRRQSGAELGFMTEYWRTAFPPLSEPGRLPAWLLEVHTSELLAWPLGGASGASIFTAILAAIGLRQLLRQRDLFSSLLLLAPAGLNLIAAILHRYPYGGHVKFSMYLGPAVCLLAGWGAATWNAKTAKTHPRIARAAAAVTIACLVLVAGSSMIRDTLRPYKTLSDERARAFAQWFWFNAEAEGPVLVVDRHEDKEFSPDADSELTWTAMFLCNRAIYSPSQQQEPLAKLPESTSPVRCLVYRDPRFEFDLSARDAWLEKMRSSNDLIATETYPFTRFGKNERDFVTVDYLDIYTFRPSPARTASTTPRAVWRQ